jgi:6-phospho-3-hexuloisomerase
MKDFQTLISQILQEQQRVLNALREDEIADFREALLRAHRIFLAGRGRSGLQMKSFAMRLMHLAMPAYVVGETTTPGIAKGDLLVIGSGSGRTLSLIVYAQKAQALGAEVALITAADTSEIKGHADHVVHIMAPTPKNPQASITHSIQPMGSLFEQTLAVLLDAIILQLMELKGVEAEEMFARHANLE